MTGDRCDYIEASIAKVFGKGAIAQQDILEIGCGGGLICHEPLAEAEGLVPTFTRISDYPEVLPDETIGCMTTARS